MQHFRLDESQEANSAYCGCYIAPGADAILADSVVFCSEDCVVYYRHEAEDDDWYDEDISDWEDDEEFPPYDRLEHDDDHHNYREE